MSCLKRASVASERQGRHSEKYPCSLRITLTVNLRNASVILTGLGASVYYAFAIVWPSMVAVLYNDGGVMASAGLSTFIGLFITLGQIVGGKCLFITEATPS
jgi:hypothetical protein